MITCIKCGVPAAFQNIHKEPWICIECQPHAAPKTQPTELDKAIETVTELNARWGYQLMKREQDALNTLLPAAKRLKELENERDEAQQDRDRLINTRSTTAQAMVYHSLLMKHETLRTEYKKALEALKKAQHEAKCEYQNKYGKECFVTRFDDALSTPLAIETMKGDQ